MRPRLLDGGGYHVAAGDVGGNEGGPVAEVARDVRAGRARQVEDRDAPTARDHARRGRAPEPGGSAGDDGLDRGHFHGRLL